MTAHGMPLSGTGSPNVLIGGLPAWRATDFHACPLTTGVQPHVGGSVATGSSTVLVNGLPAARMGDTIVESGPPNTISMGDSTVLIDTGSTSTEPAWAVSLYEQLSSLVDSYNAAIDQTDPGVVERQLRNETVNLSVTADGGTAAFSFRTDATTRIEAFRRGTREEATLRMETDSDTVDRLANSETPRQAFRQAVVDDDITIHGIGVRRDLTWRVLDAAADLADLFGLV